MINWSNLLYEVFVHFGSFLIVYLTAMVSAHGSGQFVMDWGAVITALVSTGLFHVASQRTPLAVRQ